MRSRGLHEEPSASPKERSTELTQESSGRSMAGGGGGGGGERRGAGAVVPWRWASRARLLASCVRPAGDPGPGGLAVHLRSLLGHRGTPGDCRRSSRRTGSPGHGRDRGPEGLATLCLRWRLCLLSSQTSLSARRAAPRLCLCRGDPPGRGRRCFSAILCAGPWPSSCSGRPRDGPRPAPCTPPEAASPRARAAPPPQPACSPGAFLSGCGTCSTRTWGWAGSGSCSF